MSAPINVAVLGFGMSATVFHIPFIKALPEHFNLTTIFERSATETKSAARDAFPEVKVVNTLDAVLSDPSIQLVFVSTINDTHFDYSKAALNAGKHVVVEKPLTPTSTEAHELAKLAKEKNLVLAVYQNRRWDSDYLTVKKLMKQGVFGELSEFQSNFDRFKGEAATSKLWKEQDLPGSGSAYDLGSHLIDQILELFGKPQKVTGIIRNSRAVGNPNVADSFLIHLHYDASDVAGRKLPLIATARGSILSHVSPQLRYTIKGTSASFVKHGLDIQEDQLKAGAASAVTKSDFGVEPASLAGQLYTPGKVETITSEAGSYRSWFENVADAIRSGDRNRLIVTPEQAALTIEIIEAATQSSREGRTIDL
ncbi:NAD binding Rossmann fold oxidoreductase [Leucosporidium creatinivorum]|uniref:NAD binding Rossmann fold oxidoreductase n=1 Tax=Leucosporidium creatinivorum TaxID=106004 RepID=A0A1Y2EIN8_9BASI|nr:NAD binding Rossmann fold oxidoreductase [Leucosporidium creatinivorum]